MLLKYKFENDVALTEIGDITVNSEAKCIDFKPLDNSLLSIRLRSTGSFAFDRIVDDMFNYGKADISYLGNVELFNGDEEYDKNEE